MIVLSITYNDDMISKTQKDLYTNEIYDLKNFL